MALYPGAREHDAFRLSARGRRLSPGGDRGPGAQRGSRRGLRGQGAGTRSAGAGPARAVPDRLHLRRPILQPVHAGGGCREGARAGAAPDEGQRHGAGGRPARGPGRAPVQRGGGAAGGEGPRRRAQDLPARLPGVLRGAVVLFGTRSATGGGSYSRNQCALRHRPPVCARGGSRRVPGRRSVRGPVGARAPEQRPRSGGSHRAPEPVRLHRRGGQGGLPAGARAPAVGAHALRLRLRRRRCAREHDGRRLRRPAHDRGERGPARGGGALPARRRADRGRRGHGAAARRAGAPDLLLRRRGSPRAVSAGGAPAHPLAPARQACADARPPPLRPLGSRHPRRPLPRGLLHPDRGPGPSPRAHRPEASGPGSLRRARLDARPPRGHGYVRPAEAAADGDPRRDHARLRDERPHAPERAPPGRRGPGRAAGDRHPRRLHPPHPGHRPGSRGPRERDLPEPAGARADPGAHGPRQQGRRA